MQETASARRISSSRIFQSEWECGARQEADTFEKDIKDTKRDAAESKTLLAEARQLAAEAESRSANTERKIADRHISQAQQERIRHSLAKWDGIDIRLPITMVNGDDETWTYAGELLESAAKLAINPAGEEPADRTYPVAVVVISDGRKSDRPDRKLRSKSLCWQGAS